jgi:hypothetical protein
MTDKDLQQQIQDKVFEKIRGGTVRMRPKSYFVIRFTLTAFVAIIALILSALILSFTFFSVYESGELFLLGFGREGIVTFLSLFPWIILVIDIALLLALEALLQGFKFGYRVSLFSIFVGVFVSSAVLGLVVYLTPLHAMLLDQADKGGLPLIGELYESIRDSHVDKGVFRGTIISLQENQMMISHDDNDHDSDDGSQTVMLPTQRPQLHVGDRVYVFGVPEQDGTIRAQGVQELSTDQ